MSISVNSLHASLAPSVAKADRAMQAASKAAFDGNMTAAETLGMQKSMFEAQQATAMASALMKSVQDMTMGVINNMR